ncbi:MAG: hypothetical protein J5J06_07855 [Phycisphaerae bacterium]|nr:hypothetical protein [Phycisphaerae bacterium]
MPQSLPLLAVVALLVTSGCSLNPAGGESDVPCFETPEWRERELAYFALRYESEGSDVLLLTAQTFDNRHDDFQDDQVDYSPNLAVYRFDPAEGTGRRIDDSAWDDATGSTQECCGSVLPMEPFELLGTQLFFEGRLVAVAGGKAIKTSDAPSSDALAVLSTNGRISRFYPLGSGQHYHQIFSRLDGRPLGPARRLAVGGLENNVVFFNWMNDERYVVYEQALDDLLGIGRVCIVPVTEELPK